MFSFLAGVTGLSEEVLGELAKLAGVDFPTDDSEAQAKEFVHGVGKECADPDRYPRIWATVYDLLQGVGGGVEVEWVGPCSCAEDGGGDCGSYLRSARLTGPKGSVEF